ncbi:hypothetical protein RJ640_021335 [Escallonia rubra]|uniref:Pectinesterase inhibitor domain-containing protein n=1 Tax=Escallonia rubra TaxID=112253 RepID=A0AA88UFP5_9ASTE|nr:hypothetical protein RJ640_021335 [Escallonia rubra]
MGSPHCCLLLVFLLAPVILFNLVRPSLKDEATQALIKKLCHQTADYAYCSDVFNQHLPSPTTNVVGLTQVAVSQSLLHASNTSILIHKLMGAETEETKRDIYRICQEGYSVVMDLFVQADLSLAKRDYKDMVDGVSKSQRPVNDCGSKAQIDGQLSEMNRQMGVLVNMALFLAFAAPVGFSFLKSLEEG